MISPRHYRRYPWSHERRMVSELKEHGIIWHLHICGDTQPITDDFIATGAQVLEIDHKTDAARLKAAARDKTCLLGNIDTLPEIVKAAGKVPVVIDGGFTRGTDVVKAMALGATAVAIGRLQAWALGAGGTAGLIRCLELLEKEIETTLGLLGCTSFKDLTPAHITKAMPVTLPHEHSAFPHLPGGRIL